LPSSKVPRRLQDIIDNAQAILRYTEGMDLATFEADRKTYDAVERCLERISEAAAKLGDMAVHLMPDQPWQKIRSFGNVLRHEYDAIREDRLFEIVQLNIPGLLAATKEAWHRWDTFKEP
jgi:uncharacterized protein with HEPN domain